MFEKAEPLPFEDAKLSVSSNSRLTSAVRRDSAFSYKEEGARCDDSDDAGDDSRPPHPAPRERKSSLLCFLGMGFDELRRGDLVAPSSSLMTEMLGRSDSAFAYAAPNFSADCRTCVFFVPSFLAVSFLEPSFLLASKSRFRFFFAERAAAFAVVARARIASSLAF